MQVDRRSKTGPVVNAAMLVALVAVLAIVALVTQPPTPPSVAEFAPQAVEQITDAPNNQSSQFGTGAGEGLSGTADNTSEVPPRSAPIDAARVRRCIGNPPRQIEDPQSPPCAPYFEGNNGGATHKGVTRDEIRIYRASGIAKVDDVYVDFFNKRFEFYGRRLVVVGRDASGSDSVPDGGENPDSRPSSANPTTQRSLAIEADEQYKVFASLGLSNGVPNSAYYEQLASRGVIGVKLGGRAYQSNTIHRRLAPYYWEVLASAQEQQSHLGEWTCKSLAGGRAVHGGPAVQASTRKFGIVIGTLPDGSKADIEPLRGGLAACNETPITTEVLDAPTSGAAQSREERGRAIAQFVRDGVTTIFCMCTLEAFVKTTNGADDANYEPEWIATVGINHIDERAGTGNGFLTDQMRFFIGLFSYDKINPLPDQPWYWAFKESAPPDWTHLNRRPEAGEDRYRDVFRDRYRQFLLLASGIQLAGPRLTPETFAQGLARAKFPNPGCGREPYFQACVGFGLQQSTFVSDMAMVWWDETGRSTDFDTATAGAWCYVQLGKRYKHGEWPRGAQPFQDRTKPCR